MDNIFKKNIKIISFDLDGVIVKTDYDDYIWNVLLPKEYAKRRSLKLKTAKKEVFDAYKKAMYTSEWTSLKFWFRQFDIENDYKKMLFQAKKKLKMYKDVEVIKELSKKYNLILTTQSPYDFINIKIPKLKKYFNKIYSSPDTFNSLKKEEKVYRKILQENKIRPDEMLHVGDNIKFDYEVPKRIGINTIFIDRKNFRDRNNKKKIKSIRTLKSLKRLIISAGTH